MFSFQAPDVGVNGFFDIGGCDGFDVTLFAEVVREDGQLGGQFCVVAGHDGRAILERFVHTKLLQGTNAFRATVGLRLSRQNRRKYKHLLDRGGC